MSEMGDKVDKLPEHLKRYPTFAGRTELAALLGSTISPHSQDWEWEIANPVKFNEWLAIYSSMPLSDDARFSLMETLIECVEDTVLEYESVPDVKELPEWQAIASLLRANPQLHVSSIAYWSVFGRDDPEEQFRVSVPMRQVWASIKSSLI